MLAARRLILIGYQQLPEFVHFFHMNTNASRRLVVVSRMASAAIDVLVIALITVCRSSVLHTVAVFVAAAAAGFVVRDWWMLHYLTVDVVSHLLGNQTLVRALVGIILGQAIDDELGSVLAQVAQIITLARFAVWNIGRYFWHKGYVWV